MNYHDTVPWIYRRVLRSKALIKQSFLQRLYGKITRRYHMTMIIGAKHPEPPNNTYGIKVVLGDE